MKISVVMAVYNGEKFIKRQLETIIVQLREIDELIICDDGSSDATLAIVNEYTHIFNNIKLLAGHHCGVAKNFEKGLLAATGDIIFFSDQDDVWLENKVTIMKKAFLDNPDTYVVLHDGFYCDVNEQKKDTIFERRKPKHGILRNIIFSSYYGCCMGLRREYLERILPLSNKTLYDQYIGAIAEFDHCSLYCKERLILHREHNSAWSKPRTTKERTTIRINLLWFTLRQIIKTRKMLK